jgi:glutamate-1-semialdehyde 2,1-aminomutase
MISRNKSAALFEDAKTLFPGGVNSPVRAFRSVYGPPLFIKNGSGPYLFDEDGNKFIDFCGSWGPLILGHNHPGIKNAVTSTIENGTSFGAPTELGIKLGRLIIENHRYLEKIRFVSSGTEAVMSAVRLARGFTGRNKIIKFEGCYHGHVDSLMVKAGSGLVTFGTSSSAGIPECLANETIVLALNDLAGVESTLAEHGHDIAAIIIEPIPANNGLLLQDQSFLIWLRKLCDDYDVLLILDEVISGFRVGFEGASGYYAVEPDILTFGKIIGGGLPVGAFGGRTEIMSYLSPEGPVYQAGTLSANPLAMAAGYACLSELLKEGFYESLLQKTNTFVNTISTHIEAKKYSVHIVHIGSIFWFAFGKDRIVTAADIDPKSMDHFKELHKYLLDNGVYFGPSGYEVGFISAAHDERILHHAANIICNGLDAIFGLA